MNLSQFKIHLFRAAEFVIGKQNARNLYAKWCISFYKKKNCIFIHIPKNGGTSFTHAIYGKRVGHFKSSEVIRLMGKSDFEKLFSFSIVRNPYDRLFSAYHFAKQGGGTEGGVRPNPAFKSSAFSTFDSFVSEWLVHQQEREIDIIFQPQYLFLFDDDMNCLVDFIGKLEKIPETQLFLKQKLNLDLRINFRNVTPEKPRRISIKPETCMLIYQFYKKDFDLFNYPK